MSAWVGLTNCQDKIAINQADKNLAKPSQAKPPGSPASHKEGKRPPTGKEAIMAAYSFDFVARLIND